MSAYTLIGSDLGETSAEPPKPSPEEAKKLLPNSLEAIPEQPMPLAPTAKKISAHAPKDALVNAASYNTLPEVLIFSIRDFLAAEALQALLYLNKKSLHNSLAHFSGKGKSLESYIAHLLYLSKTTISLEVINPIAIGAKIASNISPSISVNFFNEFTDEFKSFASNLAAVKDFKALSYETYPVVKDADLSKKEKSLSRDLLGFFNHIQVIENQIINLSIILNIASLLETSPDLSLIVPENIKTQSLYQAVIAITALKTLGSAPDQKQDSFTLLPKQNISPRLIEILASELANCLSSGGFIICLLLINNFSNKTKIRLIDLFPPSSRQTQTLIFYRRFTLKLIAKFIEINHSILIDAIKDNNPDILQKLSETDYLNLIKKQSYLGESQAILANASIVQSLKKETLYSALEKIGVIFGTEELIANLLEDKAGNETALATRMTEELWLELVKNSKRPARVVEWFIGLSKVAQKFSGENFKLILEENFKPTIEAVQGLLKNSLAQTLLEQLAEDNPSFFADLVLQEPLCEESARRILSNDRLRNLLLKTDAAIFAEKLLRCSEKVAQSLLENAEVRQLLLQNPEGFKQIINTVQFTKQAVEDLLNDPKAKDFLLELDSAIIEKLAHFALPPAFFPRYYDGGPNEALHTRIIQFQKNITSAHEEKQASQQPIKYSNINNQPKLSPPNPSLSAASSPGPSVAAPANNPEQKNAFNDDPISPLSPLPVTPFRHANTSIFAMILLASGGFSTWLGLVALWTAGVTTAWWLIGIGIGLLATGMILGAGAYAYKRIRSNQAELTLSGQPDPQRPIAENLVRLPLTYNPQLRMQRNSHSAPVHQALNFTISTAPSQ